MTTEPMSSAARTRIPCVPTAGLPACIFAMASRAIPVKRQPEAFSSGSFRLEKHGDHHENEDSRRGDRAGGHLILREDSKDHAHNR